MKKRLLSVLIALAVCLCAVCACADSVEATKQTGTDGLVYAYVDTGTAQYAAVLGYKGTEKHVVIPDECEDLEDNILPVLMVYDGAFSDATAFETMCLPHSCAYIGERAFAGCTELKTVYVPDSVTYIAETAFEECTTAILTQETGAAAVYAQNNGMKLGIVSFTVETTEAKNGAFGITTPAKSEAAAAVTGDIDCAVIPACVEVDGICTPVIKIAENGFKGLTIETVKLPESIKEIGAGAFADCANLTAIELPESLTAIGAGAFADCANLTAIELPESLTAIGAGAFANCANLKEITIPDSVVNFGEDIFAGCEDLLVRAVSGTAAESYCLNAGIACMGYEIARPANVVLAFNEENDLTIAWDEVPGATGYTVSKGEMSADISDTQITIPLPEDGMEIYTVTAYVTANGTTIVSDPGEPVAVTAVNALSGIYTLSDQNGTWSIWLDAQAVTDVKAVQGDNMVAIGWTEAANAEQYLICGAATEYGEYHIVTVADECGILLDKTAEAAGCEWYTVTPMVSDGITDLYGYVSDRVSPVTAEAVEGLTVVRSGAQVNVFWTGADSAEGYVLAVGTETIDVGTETDIWYVTEEDSFKVCMYLTAGGYTVVGPTAAAETVITVPAVEHFAAAVSEDGVYMAWDAAKGADGYRISVGASQDGPFEEIASTTSTAGWIAADEEKTWYICEALVQVGDKVYSGAAGESMQPVDLFTPAESAVVSIETATYGRVTSVIWAEQPNADLYAILTDGLDAGTYLSVGEVESGTYLTFIGEEGANYYILPGATVNGQLLQGTLMAVEQSASIDMVEGYAAVQTGDNVTLVWTGVDNAAGYEVYSESGDTLGDTVNTCLVLADTEADSYKISPYIELCGQRVYAEGCTAGESRTLGTIGAAGAAYAGSGINLVWEKADGAEGYGVQRCTEPDGEYKGIKSVDDTQTVTALPEEGTYYYRILPYVTWGETRIYGEPAYTGAIVEMAKVTDIKAVLSGKTVNIAWAAEGDCEAYALQRSEKLNGEYKGIKSVTDPYTGTAAPENGTYFYKVVPYVTIGDLRLYGEPTEAVGIIVPGEITEAAAVLCGKTVNIAWTALDGVDGYTLQRSTEKKGEYKGLKSVDTNSTGTAAPDSGTYFYKIIPYVTVGDTRLACGEKIVGMTDLGEITSIKAVLSGKNVTVGWTALDQADGYALERSDKKNGDYKTLKGVETAVTGTAAPESGTYFYRVTPYVLVDGIRVFGETSAPAAIITLPVTDIAILEPLGGGKVSVQWLEVDGADGYEVSVSETQNGRYTPVAVGTGYGTTVTGLTEGHLWFKVRPYVELDGGYICGEYSDPLDVDSVH